MYSLVPGGEAFSSTQPKKAGKIGKFTKHSGRKIASAPSSQQDKHNKAQDKAKIAIGNASVEELDKILESDALALLNIKKEITHAQNHELVKIRAALLSTKREYDSLFVANNSRERELNSLEDRLIALTGVDEATGVTQIEARDQMRELTDQTGQVLDDLAAEQRTIKMQTLMVKRLDEEIGKCRVDTSKAMITVEHAKHDLALAENSMQVNKQYLIEQEAQLDKLSNSLKQRKEQRDGKITMLHNLSIEGETSVAKLQHSLTESSRRSPTRTIRTAPLRSAGKVKEEDEEDLENLSELAARAKRMTAAQIREAVQRYQSQNARMERLQQQDQELKNSMGLQLKKKQELSEHLAQTQIKIQQLASTRQIYQEVDLKDTALANASKEFEEAKERDFRLRLHLESIKQAIPRFLTKVTKTSHMKTNDSTLPDAVLKLEDEVVKLIKVIGQALLKDATPDDLAMLSQQTATQADATNSEFGRLQRMPGFTRMQRQLFFNLMTARPDMTGQNVRIERILSQKAPREAGPINVSPRAKVASFRNRSMSTVEDSEDGVDISMEPAVEEALDRSTIKNISRLIVDRDTAKYKAATLAANAAALGK